MILKVWLPAAIRYGIPYETFWTMNPGILEIYQESYTVKMKEEMSVINYSAWLTGQYQMAAIGAVFSKRGRYPRRPFQLEQEGDNKSGEEKFKIWVHEFNKRFD